MAYHGAVYLTERHEVNEEVVAACNQRPSNLQRRCSRMLVKYGLTAAVGSKSPAADLYYAAVAVLIDTLDSFLMFTSRGSVAFRVLSARNGVLAREIEPSE